MSASALEGLQAIFEQVPLHSEPRLEQGPLELLDGTERPPRRHVVAVEDEPDPIPQDHRDHHRLRRRRPAEPLEKLIVRLGLGNHALPRLAPLDRLRHHGRLAEGEAYVAGEIVRLGGSLEPELPGALQLFAPHDEQQTSTHDGRGPAEEGDRRLRPQRRRQGGRGDGAGS